MSSRSVWSLPADARLTVCSLPAEELVCSFPAATRFNCTLPVQTVADVGEVVSKLAGQKRCCTKCATLKIEVEALKRGIGETI